MDTRKIPLLVMLLAGLVASIMNYVGHYELKRSLVILLLVLIGFYIFGCIIKLIFDKMGMSIEAMKKKEREEAEAAALAEAQAKQEEAAKLENVDGSVIEKEAE